MHKHRSSLFRGSAVSRLKMCPRRPSGLAGEQDTSRHDRNGGQGRTERERGAGLVGGVVCLRGVASRAARLDATGAGL